MAARARELGVNVRVARAEALPFKAEWFERGVLRMVIHLLDRPPAFAEVARVVRRGGRVVIASSDPDTVEAHWLARFYPSLAAIERARFPGEETLRTELQEAGFATVACSRLALERTMTKQHALETIRAKIYSTYDLLPPDEYAAGLARAESELPETFRHRFHWLFAVATK
jgi:ubiquinone/menaquinone biosynthesis C-methylase UbiE